MTPAPDLTTLSSSEKDALITALLARIDVLVERVAALETENAELREKPNLPPKTPDTSSTPPALGHKANGESKAKPKGKPHAGAGQGPRWSRARPTLERTGLCIPTRHGGATFWRSSVRIATPT